MNKRLMAVAAAAMVELVVLTSLAAEPNVPTPADKTVQQEHLGPIPSPLLAQAISKDGCHVAYVTRKGDKWLVVVDGKPELEYDAVRLATGALFFSQAKVLGPTGPVFAGSGDARVGYVAKRGIKWVVSAGAKPGRSMMRSAMIVLCSVRMASTLLIRLRRVRNGWSS